MSYKSEAVAMMAIANKDDKFISYLCDLREGDRSSFDDFFDELEDESLDKVKINEIVEVASKVEDKRKFLEVLLKVSSEVQANIIYYGICKSKDEFSSFVERSHKRFVNDSNKKKESLTLTH